MSFDICILFCDHHQNEDIENFSPPKKSSCTFADHAFLLPQPLATTDLFSVLTLLPFLEHHVNEIIY